MSSSATRQAPPWLEQSVHQAVSLASVPGLPDEAVLCVCRLAARLDTRALRHTSCLLGTADKLSRQLQVLAGEARRPAREIVPENAAAVLFDDPAQMLACAARDWLDGRFYRHWWWRSLLGGALAQSVIALWRRHPAHARAALAQLADRAEEFRQRLPEPDAAVIADLLEEYPARKARPIDAPEPVADVVRPHDPVLMESPAEAGVFHTSRDEPSHAARTTPIASDANDSACPATTKARQDADASSQRISEVEPAIPDRSGGIEERRTRGRSPAAGGIDTSLRAHEASAAAALETSRVARQADAGQQGSIAADPANDRRRPRPSSPSERTASLARPDITTAPSAVGGVRSTSDPAASPASFAPHAITGESIETDHGGVLYLLNAALHLGFYPDFTRPQDPGIALSPWDFLALCGERLAGRSFRRDALWSLLTTLATSPGGQTPLAPETPAPLPDMLVALHPYRGALPSNNSPAPKTWPAWIDRLIPPLRHRLAAALGVAPRRVGHLLCRQRAHIRHFNGRMDALFNLNDHPVAIRRAGLDRDPGWIPAAACDIRFHYDA